MGSYCVYSLSKLGPTYLFCRDPGNKQLFAFLKYKLYMTMYVKLLPSGNHVILKFKNASKSFFN